MKSKKLYLLIPTYNSYSRLFACLSSLDAVMPNRNFPMEVIIYDQSTLNYKNLVTDFISKLGFKVHYFKDYENHTNVRNQLFKYAESLIDESYDNYLFWMDDDFLFQSNPEKDFTHTMAMMSDTDTGIVRFSSVKDKFNRKYIDEDDIIYTGKGLMFRYFEGITALLGDGGKMVYFDDMIAVMTAMIMNEKRYRVKTNVTSIIHNAAYASTLDMSKISPTSYAHNSNWNHMNIISKELLGMTSIMDWTKASDDILLDNIICTSKRILELYNRR